MKFFTFLLINMFSFCVVNAEDKINGVGKLYDGEQIVEINKVQTLYKFINADAVTETSAHAAVKPLIIFIPGAAHLARISYGFPEGKEDDFLSYWLYKKGYPFLAVSYPTDNPVYTKSYPEFNIKEWGDQVATLAKQIITQNHLSKHVVVLGWSMGGNIEESIQESFEKQHVTLDSFIGLSAVSPLSYVGQKIKNNSEQKILPNKLLDESNYFGFFIQLLDEQNQYNNHEIIPAKIYTEQFLGNIPVALQGQGYYLEKNKFEFNLQKYLDDSGAMKFEHTPWIGLINDDALSLPKLTLIDPASWDFLRSEMLYHQYISYMNIDSDPSKFAVVKRILSQIPQHFSETVHGNHFFFVGKKGARDTAQKIEIIMQHINTTKQNLIKLGLD